MTAAVLHRPVVAAQDCRFSDWCNGTCDVQPTGDRSHWSEQKTVSDVETYDTVGVELYDYEGPGYEALAVVVCLALGDGINGVSCTSFPPEQARELGNILLGIRPADFPYNNAMLWHHLDGDGVSKCAPETYVELRQPQYRRDGTETEIRIEVSIREGVGVSVDRTQLDLLGARTLGRWLIEAADQADVSNRKFSLEGK